MKNNKGFALIIIVLIAVSVLVLGGGTYYLSTKKLLEPTETPTLTPSPTPTSAPTPIMIPIRGVPKTSASELARTVLASSI